MPNTKPDYPISLRRIAALFMPLVMAACVVLSVSVGISSGLLRTESFVQKRFEKYNSQLLDEVNTAIAGVADTTGLPTKAYTGAIQEGHINKPLMTIIFSVLIFIACVVIIDFTSYGKHKKFDYMGMGLITAGEAMVILPIFALLMKYTSTLGLWI